MGQKETLTCAKVETEASSHSPRELWSWDDPSELSRIEARGQAFVPPHSLSSHYMWAVPREEARLWRGSCLQMKEVLENDSAMSH